MKRDEFREKISHGTLMFPLAKYCWDGEFEYTVNNHWHQEIEIIYFEKGTFEYACDSNKYSVEAPALAFVNSGVMHGLKLEEGQKESALVFDCRMLSYEWYDESQSVIIEPLINQKIKLPPFIKPEDDIWDEVLDIYKKTLATAEQDNVSANLRIKLYLAELLTLLYDNDYLIAIEETKVADAYQLENIQRAITYIKDNYDKKIKVSDVSNYVGMSEEYLCRYFKKKMGKTLTEYINEIRIDKASEKLKNTEDKIIDIAVQCGYDNISYFIKRFKRMKGISPLEYRKMVNIS